VKFPSPRTSARYELKPFNIESFKMMKISRVEEIKTTPTLLFRKLSFMFLYRLTNLKCFYRNHRVRYIANEDQR
jgi:hypothetical protein